MYWATGILGFLLAIAPWAFKYSGNIPALWTSLIIGVVTIIVSLIEGTKADKERWEYWTVGVLGIIAMIAPFIFGFSNSIRAGWSSIIVGLLIVIFAGSRLTQMRGSEGGMRNSEGGTT